MPMAAADRTADRTDVDDGVVSIGRPVAAHRRVAAGGEDARRARLRAAPDRSASNASHPVSRRAARRPRAQHRRPPRRSRAARKRAAATPKRPRSSPASAPAAAADCRRRRRQGRECRRRLCRIASRNSTICCTRSAHVVGQLDAVPLGQQHEVQVCVATCTGGSRSSARSVRRPCRPARRIRTRACATGDIAPRVGTRGTRETAVADVEQAERFAGQIGVARRVDTTGIA